MARSRARRLRLSLRLHARKKKTPPTGVRRRGVESPAGSKDHDTISWSGEHSYNKGNCATITTSLWELTRWYTKPTNGQTLKMTLRSLYVVTGIGSIILAMAGCTSLKELPCDLVVETTKAFCEGVKPNEETLQTRNPEETR